MIMILEREDEAPGNGTVGSAGNGGGTARTAGAAAGVADAQLVLPFDLRSRSRFRAHLDSGEEVGVILTRGRILRGGDRLRAEDGRLIRVAAAPETVSTAHAADADQLARGAYHLGNRHVALQIGALWLRYAHDHVLDDMVRGLGLRVVVEEAPFEPEGGAYHAHGAEHGHGHGHGHGVAHGHAAGEHGHHHPHTHEH